MNRVASALSLAIAQLGDPAMMKVLVKSVLITLLVFALTGTALWFGLYQALAEQGVGHGAEIGAILAVVLTIIGGWLLFRIVALAVIQFFADEIVVAVERRHYPQALGHARRLTFAEEARNSARGIGRVLLVNGAALLVAIPLFFTAIGPAVVFWIANSWLLGRELQDIVWLRHRKHAGEHPPISALQRLALGGVVTALLAVPVANLLAPLIGTASAAHLVHRRILEDKDNG